MAVCSSCGSEVSDPSNFCTSCGQPMAKAQLAPIAASSGPVCPSCGKTVEGSSAFCTGCGQKLPATVGVEPRVALQTVAAAKPAVAPSVAAQASPFCTSCGTKIEPGIQFCTGCGAPVATREPVGISGTPPAIEQTMAIPAAAISVQPAPAKVVSIDRDQETAQHSSVSAADAAAATETYRANMPPEAVANPPEVEPALQTSSPFSPAQPAYQPTRQPGGGKFGLVVFILLIIIVGAALGGWYFWGVETIVVCSPPDVRVFLDDQEIAPTSYGRYVIPHLSRKPHLLKVQKPGFADTIERLDFPLTSSREWVNIRLVPSRQIRS